jgi:hypothetical protein
MVPQWLEKRPSTQNATLRTVEKSNMADVKIFKIFSPKTLAKLLAFLLKLLLVFFKKYDRNIGFWKKRFYFAENWQKSHKLVIITSTPVYLKNDLSIVHMAQNLVVRQI